MLRNKGIAFGYDEHGYSPSGVFQLLREKGVIQGKFKEIYWVGPGQIRVREK